MQNILLAECKWVYFTFDWSITKREREREREREQGKGKISTEQRFVISYYFLIFSNLS